MEAGWSIRRAQPHDVTAARALLTELGYPELTPRGFARVFGQVLAREDMTVLVALDPLGTPVGLMALSHRPQLRLGGGLMTVDELVVSWSARGRGLGRALLAEARREAQRRGACRLLLQTRRSRESYQRQFYVQNGFTETDSAVMQLAGAVGP